MNLEMKRCFREEMMGMGFSQRLGFWGRNGMSGCFVPVGGTRSADLLHLGKHGRGREIEASANKKFWVQKNHKSLVISAF